MPIHHPNTSHHYSLPCYVKGTLVSTGCTLWAVESSSMDIVPQDVSDWNKVSVISDQDLQPLLISINVLDRNQFGFPWPWLLICSYTVKSSVPLDHDGLRSLWPSNTRYLQRGTEFKTWANSIAMAIYHRGVQPGCMHAVCYWGTTRALAVIPWCSLCLGRWTCQG